MSQDRLNGPGETVINHETKAPTVSQTLADQAFEIAAAFGDLTNMTKTLGEIAARQGRTTFDSGEW